MVKKIGTRQEVVEGKATQTKGGLTIDDLFVVVSPKGTQKIVSKKASDAIKELIRSFHRTTPAWKLTLRNNIHFTKSKREIVPLVFPYRFAFSVPKSVLSTQSQLLTCAVDSERKILEYFLTLWIGRGLWASFTANSAHLMWISILKRPIDRESQGEQYDMLFVFNGGQFEELVFMPGLFDGNCGLDP